MAAVGLIVGAHLVTKVYDSSTKFGNQIVDPVYKTAQYLKHALNPIYPTNSIITVNFVLSPKTNVFIKLLAHTVGYNDLPEDDNKIDDYVDYTFDIAIILDYDDKNKKYKVMLGIGEEIWVGYWDITSVIRYPVNAEYFGRNPKYVKQYNADKNKWESVDEKLIVSSEEIYNEKYLESIQKQKIDAKLPSTYHYKLPQKNEICKTDPTTIQKYSTNMIVVVKPVTWPSDVYKEVVAIILECNYDTKNYTVMLFEYSSQDVIPEENIIRIIRCPIDGEYFGRISNRSMKFNENKNVWENVPEEEIKKDGKIINAHWKTCNNNINKLQQDLQLKDEYYSLKYNINNIVAINPDSSISDKYKELIAIIIYYDYEKKEYYVFVFVNGQIKQIEETEILRAIKTPSDGDYFGNDPDKSMQFNKFSNRWIPEHYDNIISIDEDKRIINEKWKTDRDNIYKLQNEYKGGRKTRHKKRKNKKRIKQKTHKKHKK